MAKADVTRMVALLGGSVVAIAAGTYLAPAAGATTLAAMAAAGAGGALANVGANLAASLTYDGMKSDFARVREWLTLVDRRGIRLPANHDMARATARAHVNAVRFIAEDLKHAVAWDQTEFDRGTLDPFLRAVLDWAQRKLEEIELPDFLADAPVDQALREVEALIEERRNAPPNELLRDLQASAADAARRDLLKEIERDGAPKAFEDQFYARDRYSSGVGWVLAARAFFAEELKTNPRLRTAVFLDLLNRSAGGVDEANNRLDLVLTALRNQGADLTARFDRLEAEIAKLRERQVSLNEEGEAQLHTAMIAALAQFDFAGALRRRAAVEAPGWDAEAARIDVRDRVAELSVAFYGRGKELKKLDDFIEGRDRGLAVVAAPAGSGKSALLAGWLNRRRSFGDIVVRHFISTNFEPATTNSVSALRHLTAQLRDLDGLDPADPANRISDSEVSLIDKLVERVGRPPPGGERLIVLVDGLDDLEQPLTDVFVRGTLAERVFLVVSGRALAGETPPHLRRWLEIRGVAPWRFDVPGLPVADVLLWLEEYVGHLHEAEMGRIAEELRRTTEGLPLFLHYVMEDLRANLPRAKTPEERMALVGDLPAGFASYVSGQLEKLRGTFGSPQDFDSWRKLFALLTQTRGPIEAAEIKAFFRFHGRRDATFPPAPPLDRIDRIDDRLTRWFSIRGEGQGRRFAFAHLRLAKGFAEALGDELTDAEDDLIEWMKQGWQEEAKPRGPKQGASYALDWLPAHLLGQGDEGPTEAARLLSSPTFLSARLANPDAAVRRLRAALDAWNAIDDLVRDRVPGAAPWRAFWAENETALLWASEASVRAGLDPRLPTIRCIGDADTAGSDPKPHQGLAWTPHPPRQRGLLRSINNAHQGGVRGVLAVGERLVSWGWDGAIRFWTREGTRAEGGDDNAHRGGVGGVLAVGERLVSWGGDCAIRFWTREGARAEGGDDHAHQGPVRGVLEVGERLVSWSWDWDGAIRFWTR